MKVSKTIFGIAALLALAVSGQAALFTSLDWKLSLPGNPTALDSSSVNPSNATVTARFRGNNNTYYFGQGPGGGGGYFGPPTGLWDVNNGDLLITLSDKTAHTPLDYTLIITHFVDNQLYPGTAIFSGPGLSSSNPNYTSVSRTVVVPQSGNMGGYWAADTYTWSQVSISNDAAVSLDIIPGSGSGGAMLFDEVQFSINGDLIPIPEPGIIQLAASSLLVLGLSSWFRRNRKA
jgi:hypothetical protein